MDPKKPGKRSSKKPATRQPVQARGIATVEALLEAAARVLSKEDFERFTTNRVAEVAGVGIGSLYEYFPDKRELLAKLTERFAASIEASATRTIRAQDGIKIGQALATSLGAVLGVHQSRAELHRKLLEQAPYLPRTNPLSLIELPIREALVDMLRSHTGEIIVDDLEVAAINIGRICRGMVESAASDPIHAARSRHRGSGAGRCLPALSDRSPVIRPPAD